MSYQNSGYNNEKMSTQNMQSDRPLLIAVIFLVVIGLMAIFSASAPKCIEMGVNPARFLIQQMIGVAVGFVGLKFLSNFHYKKLMQTRPAPRISGRQVSSLKAEYPFPDRLPSPP